MTTSSRNQAEFARTDPTVLKSVSGHAPTPTPPSSLPRQQPNTTPPAERPPTPTLTLLAELQGLDVEALGAGLVGVRAAWRQGDQGAIADALIDQAALLETLAAKLLRLAGTDKTLKGMDTYGHLALRALEQARKALGTLATIRGGPRQQTNIQVNVGGSTKEVLSGEDYGA